jgi:hypothetical protein
LRIGSNADLLPPRETCWIAVRLKYGMTKDEFTKKFTKLNQIMDELIYALMQTGMTYRQAEEEVFTMLKRKRSSKDMRES